MVERLGLIVRCETFLRSFLILTNLIIVIGDFVNVESLTHSFSGRHSTLIVRHWVRTNLEASWLHGWIQASWSALWHQFLCERGNFSWILGIVAVKFVLLHVSWFFWHVLRVGRWSHVRFAIVTHMSITIHGRSFWGDSVTRKGCLGRVDLLLMSHLLAVSILNLLVVCLVLIVLLQRSLIFQWVAHMLRLKLDLIMLLSIWWTLISILMRNWLHGIKLICVLLGTWELVMFVWLLFNRVLSLVSLVIDGLLIWGIHWAFLMILLLRIEAFHLFGAIRIKAWLFLGLLFVKRNLLFFMILMSNLLRVLVLRGLGGWVNWLWVIWLRCGALMKRIGVFLLRNVRMLLIFITLIVFICDLILVFIPRLLHFLLHVRGENWIFCQDFFLGHL